MTNSHVPLHCWHSHSPAPQTYAWADTVRADRPSQWATPLPHAQMRGVDYRHTDNINFFLAFLKKVGLPKIFHPSTLDVYERQNLPRLVYCLHCLSHLLQCRGVVPQAVEKVQGDTFSGERAVGGRGRLLLSDTTNWVSYKEGISNEDNTQTLLCAFLGCTSLSSLSSLPFPPVTERDVKQVSQTIKRGAVPRDLKAICVAKQLVHEEVRQTDRQADRHAVLACSMVVVLTLPIPISAAVCRNGNGRRGRGRGRQWRGGH